MIQVIKTHRPQSSGLLLLLLIREEYIAQTGRAKKAVVSISPIVLYKLNTFLIAKYYLVYLQRKSYPLLYTELPYFS